MITVTGLHDHNKWPLRFQSRTNEDCFQMVDSEVNIISMNSKTIFFALRHGLYWWRNCI